MYAFAKPAYFYHTSVNSLRMCSALVLHKQLQPWILVILNSSETSGQHSNGRPLKMYTDKQCKPILLEAKMGVWANSLKPPCLQLVHFARDWQTITCDHTFIWLHHRHNIFEGNWYEQFRLCGLIPSNPEFSFWILSQSFGDFSKNVRQNPECKA